MAIYSVPDVHGNLDGLKNAIEKILLEFDKDKDKIILMGDYIDRGFHSLGVIQYLMEKQNYYGSDVFICLLGNHDDMFLNWLHNPTSISFLQNDYALRTIKSFVWQDFDVSNLYFYNMGIYNLNTMDELTFKIHKYINKNYPNIKEWLSGLPLYYDRIKEDNTLYVHGGIEENMLGKSWKDFTSNETYIWKFPPSYGDNPYGFNIVAGHCMVHQDFWKFTEEPCYDIYVTGNHYYIDGGSPMNPVLNILKYDSGKFHDYLNDRALK